MDLEPVTLINSIDVPDSQLLATSSSLGVLDNELCLAVSTTYINERGDGRDGYFYSPTLSSLISSILEPRTLPLSLT